MLLLTPVEWRWSCSATTIPFEIFYTLKEAQIIIEQWRKEYNQIRPHSSLHYRPPAPEAILLPPLAAPLLPPAAVTTTY